MPGFQNVRTTFARKGSPGGGRPLAGRSAYLVSFSKLHRSMSDQPTIIFSMAGVSKIYPPQKQVLKNIYLSFFYGAKIGVLGLNGSGKSTLLKIMAGVDKEYEG